MKDESMESKVQEVILTYLEEKRLAPYSVLYSKGIDKVMNTLIKITFWLRSDIEDFKKTTGLSTICDNSGFMENKEENTIVITGLVLTSFLETLKDYGYN